MKTTFLIIDDHTLIRRGLKMLIETKSDYSVIGQAPDAIEAQSLLKEIKPDIIVIDISIPGMIGLDLIKRLLAIHPDLKIIVISDHNETIFAERAIRAGARAYVMKQNISTALFDAIDRILNGGIYLSEVMNRNILLYISGHNRSNDISLDMLSDRELEVFDLTGHGLDNREIADSLLLSIKTVESYRVKIRNKLKLKKIKDLDAIATKWVERKSVG